MNIEFDCDKDYKNSAYYGMDLYDNKDLCLICCVDETEDGEQWQRYKTKCGHIFHTRCFRRWCGVKNCINCSLCGDIKEIKQNRHCHDCNKFGHAYECGDDCPIMTKIYGRRQVRKKVKPLFYNLS